MIRTWMFPAIALLVACLSSASALAGPEDNDDIKKILSELKDLRTKMDSRLSALEFQQKMNDQTSVRLDRLEKMCTDAITRLDQKIASLNPPSSRISGAFEPQPLTGRINLINDWDLPVTYYINQRTYTVGARQQLPVDVPSGLVSYEIWGDGFGVIESKRSLTLDAGRTMNMQVYRR
jgi:hypothetical protein